MHKTLFMLFAYFFNNAIISAFYKGDNISASIINNIKIDIPYKQIIYRLGYKKNINIKHSQQKEINNIIQDGFLRCTPKCIYSRCSIDLKNNDTIVINKELNWNSKSLLPHRQN